MSVDRTGTSAETEAEEPETVARGTADKTPAVAIGAAAVIVGSLFVLALGLAGLGYWIAG